MKHIDKYIKGLYIFFGTITLVLGAVGVVIPGLPTTPLLLLSVFLYSKGSKRLHKALLESNFVGRYINKYTNKSGMTRRDKVRALVLMWTMITISTTLLIKISVVRIIVLLLGIIGSTVIIFVLKTVAEDNDD